MSMHKGRLWLVPERDSKLRVDIYLDSEHMRITSHGVLIGDWPISEVEVREIGSNRVRLFVEGEEVVVSSRDPEFMPSLLDPLSGDEHRVASRRPVSSFNGPGSPADQEEVASEVESADRSSPESPSNSETSSQGPEPESPSGRGANRATRRLPWRNAPNSQAG